MEYLTKPVTAVQEQFCAVLAEQSRMNSGVLTELNWKVCVASACIVPSTSRAHLTEHPQDSNSSAFPHVEWGSVKEAHTL